MDEINSRVQNEVRELVVGAYDTRAPVELRFCECGHEDGAHHGPDGELHCGEDGCGCQRFTLHHTEERLV